MRWTEEEKLPVIDYGSFRKAGSDHAYPFYEAIKCNPGRIYH
jgi:hypothetical protein